MNVSADDIDDVESLVDPWKNIIAKKKHYHGIRVRDKKNTYTYKSFSEKVVDQWSAVKEKCSTAMKNHRSNHKILFMSSKKNTQSARKKPTFGICCAIIT